MRPVILFSSLAICLLATSACSTSKPVVKETPVQVVQQAPKQPTTPKTYKDAPCANPDWARLPPGMEPVQEARKPEPKKP